MLNPPPGLLEIARR